MHTLKVRKENVLSRPHLNMPLLSVVVKPMGGVIPPPAVGSVFNRTGFQSDGPPYAANGITASGVYTAPSGLRSLFIKLM